MFKTKGIKPEKKLFHNIWIDVYPTKVEFEKIQFWKDNLRTILSFDLLKKKYKKRDIQDISEDDITDYLASKKRFKIEQLAENIGRNGVRVPLIVLEDGTLLDGNRRYFACRYLKKSAEINELDRPSVLDTIPIWIIKKKNVSEKTKQKILAEANFVSDHKVEWTLDVKAKVIDEFFGKHLKKSEATTESVLSEILDVYGVDKETVDAYVEAKKLADKFVNDAVTKERDLRREIVQEKFVYFWEFRNKSQSGKLLLEKKEYEEAKKMFFNMMATDRIKNMKQIEPMIRAVRDKYSWKILKDSAGSKIDQVEAIYKSQKSIKTAEDKVRNFQNWLTRLDSAKLTPSTIRSLQNLAKKIDKILNGR
jgi:ParB-like chromosome segregation protein Spo0J